MFLKNEYSANSKDILALVNKFYGEGRWGGLRATGEPHEPATDVEEEDEGPTTGAICASMRSSSLKMRKAALPLDNQSMDKSRTLKGLLATPKMMLVETDGQIDNAGWWINTAGATMGLRSSGGE